MKIRKLYVPIQRHYPVLIERDYTIQFVNVEHGHWAVYYTASDDTMTSVEFYTFETDDHVQGDYLATAVPFENVLEKHLFIVK